jgi:hypothetical protein
MNIQNYINRQYIYIDEEQEETPNKVDFQVSPEYLIVFTETYERISGLQVNSKNDKIYAFTFDGDEIEIESLDELMVARIVDTDNDTDDDFY